MTMSWAVRSGLRSATALPGPASAGRRGACLRIAEYHQGVAVRSRWGAEPSLAGLVARHRMGLAGRSCPWLVVQPSLPEAFGSRWQPAGRTRRWPRQVRETDGWRLARLGTPRESGLAEPGRSGE